MHLIYMQKLYPVFFDGWTCHAGGLIANERFLLRVLFRVQQYYKHKQSSDWESQTLEMPLFKVVWFCAEAKHISDLT